ncbi:hypothetical protein NEF87_001077 [Candidatus Lokiarchaeum ossiferum]|uniref:Condensation domain-containing protein n=1 Tax=Candidatus Lokiarchaeum ossiferum TaxID=2951803 RepID=A0ABY6HMQ8_9ARCH|nr:hypothetical protein NEF87_001077 [Candidatus Lokiarchaeum sp. B-35]
MIENKKNYEYTRELFMRERAYYRIPGVNVFFHLKIRGQIQENQMKLGIKAVQARHVLLRCKIIEDEQFNPYFTTESCGEIELKSIILKESNDWFGIMAKESITPFEFDKRPLIRFILGTKKDISNETEILIVCHHCICDGLSLGFLTRDLMQSLAIPPHPLEILAPPAGINIHSIPEEIKPQRLLALLIKKMNKKWQTQRIQFDQEDFRNLFDGFARKYNPSIIYCQVPKDITKKIIRRSKKEGITINTVILTAIQFASSQIQRERKKSLREVTMAVGGRHILQGNLKETFGFHAISLKAKFRYENKKDFWDNARIFHRILQKKYDPQNLLSVMKTSIKINPEIADAMPYKILSSTVPSGYSRYEKLSSFGKRKDLFSKFIKKSITKSLGAHLILTNIGNLDFQVHYGDLELEEISFIPPPSDAFEKILGVVTFNGKMNLCLRFSESNVNRSIIKDILNLAVVKLAE